MESILEKNQVETGLGKKCVLIADLRDRLDVRENTYGLSGNILIKLASHAEEMKDKE